MRTLTRAALPEHARELLAQWTTDLPGQLAACADPDEARAKKARAALKRRWDRRRASKAMRQVEETLIAMNGRLANRCMYCEDNEAIHLDHHEPRSRAPLRVYDWDNLVLACDVCDTRYKRDQFVDPTTRARLLSPIGPDAITDHFWFTSTGKAATPTPEGAWTVRAIGLDRQTLETARRDRWAVIAWLIPRFAEARTAGRDDRAQKLAGMIREPRLLSVLRDVVRAASAADPGGAGLTRVAAALAAWPEIAGWAD